MGDECQDVGGRFNRGSAVIGWCTTFGTDTTGGGAGKPENGLPSLRGTGCTRVDDETSNYYMIFNIQIKI